VTSDPHGKVPKARRGLAHVLDATGYSLAGARRLSRETAARLELLAVAGAVVAFAVAGASLWQWITLLCLGLAVFLVEALNTAIEVLVDRISPEWSVEARDAKDLGSLAVGLSLAILGVFVAAVLFGG
jgi:diacylglycerol kinase (ATP)